MAITPQSQAMRIIETKISLIDDRYDTYKKDLAELLNYIVELELDKSHKIVQLISAHVTRLGKHLMEKGDSTE